MTYTAFTLDPSSQKGKGELLRDRFQAVLDRDFLEAPDVYTIREQDGIGLDTYHDIDVRINRGIKVYSGREIGDDWRLLMFREPDHPIVLGLKYFFNDNWWLVYNIEQTNNLAASCMVKRCNNVLRWKDINGDLHDEPCIFDLVIARARDQMTAEDLVNVQGYINCYVQLNEHTALIEENQRFLVGRPEKRVAYKVFGGGIRNFINGHTYDDNSASILLLTLGSSHINPATDDLENGIANAFPENFEVDNPPHQMGDETIVITPQPKFILEGEEITYTTRLLDSEGGEIPIYFFDVTVSNLNTVPASHFELTKLDGNMFKVKNIQKYLYDTLKLIVSVNNYVWEIEIELRGLF